MANYKIAKPIINHNEYVMRCPHCQLWLVRTIDMRDIEIKVMKYESCPSCYGWI